jgi:hypothetical protein
MSVIASCSMVLFLACTGCGGNFSANNAQVAQSQSSSHGMWVWNGTGIASDASRVALLHDVAVAKGIDEVYISAVPSGSDSSDRQISNLISTLHASSIRVEALLGSSTADEPGAPRDGLVTLVQNVISYNQRNPQARFDGVHLDIEPQQRPEYTSGIGYLPNLIATYQAANSVAAPAGLAINADIAKGVISASLDQRRALLTSVPRLTLMLYQLGTQADSQSAAQNAAILDSAATDALQRIYDGVSGPGVATLAIGLNTPDFGADSMPQMFVSLEQSGKMNSHYSGWSWEAYSDILASQQ